MLLHGSYGQEKPDKPGKVGEFQNYTKVREKSGNFKITQKVRQFLKMLKFREFSKLLCSRYKLGL